MDSSYSSSILLGLDTLHGVVLAFDLQNELATKGTTERRSTSPSVNRTEPEKKKEEKLGLGNGTNMNKE